MLRKSFRGSFGGGGGGGSAPQPHLTPDNLRSKDTVEVIFGLCEGEIEGLERGPKSFYVGDTQLQNDDGNYNFQDFNLTIFPGLESPAPVVPKLGGDAQNTTVSVRLFHGTPVTRTTNSGQIDFIQVRILFQGLYKQNTSGTFNESVTFDLKYKAASSGTWHGFYSTPITITGKTTSPYVKTFRVAVPRINEPYDVQVLKSSEESDSISIRDIAWESMQEIDASPRSYPNTAIAQLVGQASDQFSSIPQFWGVYKLMRVLVPTNYDPVARTYTGLWDGTFKKAWTSNPAWVLYYVVMNDVWGMARYFPNINMDKFDVYEAGVWCDQLVPNGLGGYQPRYTFNAVITEPQDGKALAQYIAGTFNAAIFDDLNGNVVLKVDKDETAVAMFTPENVSSAGFEYSYTDLSVRYNDLVVAFNNPALNWQEDRRRVFKQAEIDRIGRVPLDFIAVGCTNVQEAIRRGKYKLLTATTETKIVKFTTNRFGQFVAPWEICLVADPDMGFAMSGRIKSVSLDRKTITLRDPIYLESGVHYTAQFQMPDRIDQYTITPGVTGSVTSITFATALAADLPAQAVFNLGGGAFGLPKPFRVLTIDEAGPDDITVTAIEVNRNKWSDADNLTDSGIIQYSVPKSLQHVLPVSSLTAVQAYTSDALGLHLNINLTAGISPDPFVRRLRFEYTFNGGATQLLKEGTDNEVTLQDAPAGDYTFICYAVSIAGMYSPPVTTSIHIGDTAPIDMARVTGLEIENQGNDVEFDTPDVKFDWRANSITGSQNLGAEIYGANTGWLDPTFRDFEFKVYDPATDNLLFTDYTTNNSYRFSFAQNAMLEGGPYRNFRVEVCIRDRYNRKSPAAKLTVNNPVPPLPTNVGLRAAFNSLFLSYTPPQALDWAGLRVWVDTTSGFTPSDDNLVYDGTDTLIVIDGRAAGTTYYVRFAAYDNFGFAGSTMSPELSIETAYIDAGDIADGIIGIDKLADDLAALIGDGIDISALLDPLRAQYTVKVSVDGYVAGYGLAIDAHDATPVSEFIVLADKFAVITPGTPRQVPFAIGTVDGVTKTVINSAIIGDATIGSAKISDLTADKILAGQIGAQIISVGGDRLRLRGDIQQIEIRDNQGVPRTRVQLGKLGAGTTDYGLAVYDAAGTLIMSTSAGVPVAGAIAGQGPFATLSQITSGNISTYIASAAITSAQIASLSADKITAGTITANTSINLGSHLSLTRLSTGEGKISITDNANHERVLLGFNGSNYGLRISDAGGNKILDADGLGVSVVNTSNLISNAVTDSGAAYTDGQIAYGTSYTLLQTITVGILGSGPVFVNFTARIVPGVTSDITYSGSGENTTSTVTTYTDPYDIQVLRDGTAVFSLTNLTSTGPLPIGFADNPPVGTHTYDVKIKAHASANGKAFARSLLVLGVKR